LKLSPKPSCDFAGPTHKIKVDRLRSGASAEAHRIGRFLQSKHSCPKSRRDGRVAEGARLESVFTRKGNVGSNPTLSASFSNRSQTCGFRELVTVFERFRAGSDPGASPCWVAKRAYAPYGEQYNTFGSSNPPYGVFASETGDFDPGILFDTPNRELASGQGRWVSPDPAGAIVERLAPRICINPALWTCRPMCLRATHKYLS